MKRLVLVIIVISLVLFGACAPTAAPPTPTPSPAEQPTPGTTTKPADFEPWAEAAITWAQNNLGSDHWYELCLRFAANAFMQQGEPPAEIPEGTWTSALDAINGDEGYDLVLKEPDSWGNAPRGTLIFFDKTDDNQFGHVGIYLGDGRVIHSYGKVRIDDVEEAEKLDQGRLIGAYLGWAYPPERWRPKGATPETQELIPPTVARVGDFSVSINNLSREKDLVTLKLVVTKVSIEGGEGNSVSITLIDDHNNNYSGKLTIDMSGAQHTLATVPVGFSYVETVKFSVPEKAPIEKIIFGDGATLSQKDIQFASPDFKSEFGKAVTEPGTSFKVSDYLNVSIGQPTNDLVGWNLPLNLENQEYNPLPVGITLGIQFTTGELRWQFLDWKTEVEGSNKQILNPRLLTATDASYGYIPKRAFIEIEDMKTGEHYFRVVPFSLNQFPQIPERITYASTAWGPDLYLIETDGSNKIKLTSHDPMRESTGFKHPSWSKDGAKLVAQLSEKIVMMDSDGSNKVEITGGYEPTFSPDGTRIAFTYGGKIYIANIDGSDKRMLTEGNNPDWSPDGNTILFDYTTDPFYGYDLYVINIDGSGRGKLGPGKDGTWSPDGKRIVYQGRFPIQGFNTDRIAVMNADGSGVTILPFNGSDPKWSPAGTQLIFELNSVIYITNVDGSNEIKFGQGITPAWAPAFRLGS